MVLLILRVFPLKEAPATESDTTVRPLQLVTGLSMIAPELSEGSPLSAQLSWGVAMSLALITGAVDVDAVVGRVLRPLQAIPITPTDKIETIKLINKNSFTADSN